MAQGFDCEILGAINRLRAVQRKGCFGRMILNQVLDIVLGISAWHAGQISGSHLCRGTQKTYGKWNSKISSVWYKKF